MEPNRWYEIILSFSFVAIVCAILVHSFSFLFFVSYFFGFVFVAFIPGYCLVTILFSKEKKLDWAEQAVLSVALSFSIAGLTGLFLGLSPIGINITSTLVALSAIALVLATLAFLKQRKDLGSGKSQILRSNGESL